MIILAMVLFIALIGVYLLGYFPETAQDISSTESLVYWQGQARPVRVNAGAVGNGTFCGRTNSWGYVFSVENAEVDPINITAVTIDGVSIAI